MAGVTLFAHGAARAEQLPLRAYTTSDGLAHDFVLHISQDSRGYLWIGTEDGLSRFDGYEFVNYGVADGLPSPSVRSVLEGPDGAYWIGTGKGLCRMDPVVPPRAHSPDRPWLSCFPVGGTAPTDSVTDILLSRAGRLWVGTAGGLFARAQGEADAAFQKIPLGRTSEESGEYVHDLSEGADGSLWIGFQHGLARWVPGGRVVQYRIGPATGGRAAAVSVLSDSQGRLWFGWRRLFVLAPGAPPTVGSDLVHLPDRARTVGPLPSSPGDVRVFEDYFDSEPGERPAQTIGRVYTLMEASDGRVWAGTESGLCAVEEERLRCHSQSEGLPEPTVRVLAEDRHGGLWMGAEYSGAFRLERGGMSRFTRKDGLADERIDDIAMDAEGRIFVVSGLSRWLHRLGGGRFHPVRAGLAAGIAKPSWGWNQVVLKDREGDWWVASGEGLLRFPATVSFEDLGRSRPRAIYTRSDGLSGENIFRLYEDARGDIWIGTMDGEEFLSRWERSTGRFHRYPLPGSFPRAAPTAFAEDRLGDLWIGFYSGGLARYRQGRFDLFAPGDLLPPGLVFDLFLDSAGRLWIATSRGGAGRLDDPAAANPNFVWWTRRQGLASDQVQCIAEDRWGRIYLGTGRGVNRLDPATGSIRHLTTAEGLTHNNVRIARTDARGDIWFGALSGVSRLRPEPDRDAIVPEVLITHLEIAGTSHALSDLGEKAIGDLRIGPAQDRITIGFTAPSPAPAEPLRYQFRMEGAGEDWSEPSPQRSVRYAGLAPGTYRFLVRAVTSGGAVSADPASVAFTITPPFWRRGWFLAAAALGVLGIAAAIHRARLARAVAVERMRTQIATDLHDDLGGSLSRISILSEVVTRSLEDDPVEARSRLADIGETARDLAEALSDTVWSINPLRDDLGSLVIRLRHFASGVLEGRGIRWSLEAPEPLDGVRLPAGTRRHLFLILKEAVNNVARHSQAGTAAISIRIEGGEITAEVSDDGRGFTPAKPPGGPPGSLHGNGLRNMRARAEAAGGSLAIDTEPGRGARLTARLPLRGTHDHALT